jgi:hypothetical protein
MAGLDVQFVYRTTLSNPASIDKSNPRRNSQSGSLQNIVIFKAMRQLTKQPKQPPDLKMKTCDLKSKIKTESLATWQNQ